MRVWKGLLRSHLLGNRGSEGKELLGAAELAFLVICERPQTVMGVGPDFRLGSDSRSQGLSLLYLVCGLSGFFGILVLGG